MPYLTYEEYKFWGNASVTEEAFPKLLQKASDVIDSVTRAFYQFNDINMDVPYRREQFKKAIAAQIDYFDDMGAKTAHGLSSIQSVTIGRTSISGKASANVGTNILSSDALMYLQYTGLIYSGVRCC